MEFILNVIKSPFTWGLLLGLLFFGMAFWNLWKTKLEFSRYRKHLSDKMEIEADQVAKMKEDKEKLSQENENLRIKVGSTKDTPAKELERELEIFARAEKAMILNAPGFAQAWESAKSVAMDEILEEERGKSLPRRIFKKFLKGGTSVNAGAEMLPEEGTATTGTGTGANRDQPAAAEEAAAS